MQAEVAVSLVAGDRWLLVVAGNGHSIGADGSHASDVVAAFAMGEGNESGMPGLGPRELLQVREARDEPPAAVVDGFVDARATLERRHGSRIEERRDRERAPHPILSQMVKCRFLPPLRPIAVETELHASRVQWNLPANPANSLETGDEVVDPRRLRDLAEERPDLREVFAVGRGNPVERGSQVPSCRAREV